MLACRNCHHGSLVRTSVHRHQGPLLFIGYALAIAAALELVTAGCVTALELEPPGSCLSCHALARLTLGCAVLFAAVAGVLLRRRRVMRCPVCGTESPEPPRH